MKKFIISLLFLMLSVSAYSQEVTIVTEDFPPYNYEEEGVAKGISSEVVQAVLQEIGMTAGITFYSWARAYNHTLTKKNYLIYSIARIPEREELFHWVGTIAPYNTSLYKLQARRDITVASLDDAKRYVIGCSLDDVITIYLKEQGFSRLDTVARDTLNLRKLIGARVDLIAYDEASFVYKMQQEKLDISKFERVYRLEDLSDNLYMAFSKTSDPAVVEKFRDGLRTIKENGIFENIQKKYSFDEKDEKID